MKYVLYFIIVHLNISAPQTNCQYTNEVNEIDNKVQRDRIRIAASIKEANSTRQIISYRISEPSAKFNIEPNKIFSRFTFVQLSKQNITSSSEELYKWSTSIYVIERYQLYFNQLPVESSFENEFFYSYTFARFGSMCQYEFHYYHSEHPSLYEIIHHFYHNYEYKPSNIACYTDLKCDRGHLPAY